MTPSTRPCSHDLQIHPKTTRGPKRALSLKGNSMFEAYKIGIHLKLQDGVTAGLLALSNRMRIADRDVVHLQDRLEKLRKSAAIGIGEMGLGVGILAAFKPAVEAANEYQQQIARLGAMGFGDQITQQAAKAAAGMKIMGASIIQTTEALRDALAIAPHLDEAKILAPTLARVPFAARMYGLEPTAAHTDALNMLRAAEQREGMTHPHKILAAANEFWQMAAFSGWRLTGADFRGLASTGGVAFKLLSMQGLRNLEPVLQEMGGRQTGTGLMSAYNNLIEGRMLIGNSQIIQTLQKLNLLDLHKTIRAKNGNIKRLMPGAVLGTSTLQKDPAEWLKDYFLPTAIAHGYTTLDQQIGLLNDITSNRTAARILTTLLQNLPGLPAKSAQIAKTDNIDQAASRYSKTAQGQYDAAGAAWTTAKVNFGGTVLPYATEALTGLTHLITSLTGLMDRHATATKILAGALVTLGAGLAISGTVTLATTAFRGLGLALAFETAGGASGIASAASALAKLAGPVAALAGVGWAAYEATKWAMHKTGLDTALSQSHLLDGVFKIWAKNAPTWLGGMGSSFHDPDDTSWQRRSEGFVSHHPIMVQVNHQTRLDSRTLHESVTQYLSRGSERSPIGPNDAISSLAMPSPALTGGMR
jgi:hypothetical protein